MGSGGSSGKSPPIKKVTAETTATPVEQLSEAAKKNRRTSAALLSNGFSEPTLSNTGLLGVPQ